MIPQTVLLELRLRLNKLHSSDYDNIPDWIAVKAIRKAQLQVMRRTIHGVNRTQEGDEVTRIRVDDLQQFLTTKRIGGVNKKSYFESEVLPGNYLFYKSLEVTASTKDCRNKRLYSQLVEEANVEKYLADWSMKPDFKWRSTFHIITGNKIRIYTDGDFTVNSVSLSYYRKPQEFDISGYTHEDASTSSNVDLEWKDDLAHSIIDEAASILSADLELINQLTTSKQNTDINI